MHAEWMVKIVIHIQENDFRHINVSFNVTEAHAIPLKPCAIPTKNAVVCSFIPDNLKMVWYFEITGVTNNNILE